MTMCAAITVPIIKDGYRLYPGMPVSSQGSSGASNNQQNPRSTKHNTLYYTQISGSPPDSNSSMASSPPGTRNHTTGNGNSIRTGIIVGGVTGGGVHHQVVLLQPRNRSTSNQSQISARSSLEVGPTMMTDQGAHRTAMSTSQLYIQKRRELCIQQQLQKQELARKQQQQAQMQQRSSTDAASCSQNDSSVDDQRKRKSSQGDHNNNSDNESVNPFRKLLRRLGFGGGASTSSASNANPQRHVAFQDSMISADCESGIEQAVPAAENAPMAVMAWH